MLFLVLLLVGDASACIFYDTFTGRQLSDNEYLQHVERNSTFWCTNQILPCDPQEGRRIDGSCNNLKNFTLGAPHTPQFRLLPPYYSRGYEPRLSKKGELLPYPRTVRTRTLPEGHVPDPRFTHLFTHIMIFVAADYVSVHDSINFMQWTPHCCTEQGKYDPVCISNVVPDDDPVHKFSEVRCLNLTRPLSFQSQGCIAEGSLPERIVSETPAFDLSCVYGASLDKLNERGRLFKDGLLKTEVEDGKIFPPSTTGPNVCSANKPDEPRCHATPTDAPNTILGIQLGSLWVWRYHNVVASALAKINPCWSDDQLFFTARDITIASIMQMYYYELLPLMMGRENLIRDGVISSDPGFRDIYDDNEAPTIPLEFTYAWRWAHTVQEGLVQLYDDKGNMWGEEKLVNMTFRPGFVTKILEGITQGAIRQPAAKFDYVVDPDVAETILGPLQRASDVFTNDLTKGRYFFFAPYIKYREYCFGEKISGWDDLKHAFEPENLEVLKEKYDDVEDMDLMAGMWLERNFKDSIVPATFYCIVSGQQHRYVKSDRHWYERSNRPNAFTLEQLLEVRKFSSASFMCQVGDSISEIQPQAFLQVGPGNEMRPCSEIETPDFNAWKDPRCDA